MADISSGATSDISPAEAAFAPAKLTTADGKPLKEALIAAQARARRRAFYLVAPLLVFVLLAFIVPIGQMLHQSIYNADFTVHVDKGTKEETPIMVNLQEWFDATPAQTAPDEAAFAALAQDLIQLRDLRGQGEVGTRINYEVPGTRSLFTKSARRAPKLEAPFKDSILAIDEDWADPLLWQAMRNASSPYSINFYLAALDLTRNAENEIVAVDENRQIRVKLFIRTGILSVIITVTCFFLAFPIAHLLATMPLRYSNLLMILVLLPFWTSLLVRTTSWIVLLQSQGVLNDVMVALGIVGDDGRVQLIYNEIGTVIAMTHILLPFMVLPLFSVMRVINPSYVRAARSLGATSWTAFRRIYLPQCVPGIGAGSLLVFILAVGYYITPALVGGAKGTLISNEIAFHMTSSLNWSLAAALAALLLAGVLILYWLYDRLIGIDNLKLG
ncbi:MAG: putative spermidine/putrescine transport system permease protein [Paracoccaceae bacterium]|jgi:putative spermidine/putrescine transport system permease protein